MDRANQTSVALAARWTFVLEWTATFETRWKERSI